MRRLTPLLLLLAAACSRDADDAAAASRPQAEAVSAAAGRDSAALMKGEMRSFRDWDAVCDNTRTCTLFGFSGEGGMSGVEGWGFIRIERKAGPGTDPVVLVAAGEAAGGAEGALPMTVAVDGQAPLRLEAAGENGPYYMGRVNGAEARALIASLRNGRTLTVGLQGFQPAALSLDGAAAALLWADEVQGRVGARDALMRPGDRSSVPAAPAPPVVRAVRLDGGEAPAPPGLLRQKVVADCLANEVDSSSAETTGVRLTADLVLWQIPCGSGAYNQTTAFYFGDPNGGGLRPVALSEGGGEGDGPGNQLINAGVDPETGRLSSFAKSRGVGDCGAAQEWVWDGRAFVSVSELVMGRCSGVTSDDWPVVHRAEVR